MNGSIQVVTEVPSLPPRPADAHKGRFGRVLIVAGSRGMSGAAALGASAALRGGAGLVRVAVPSSILPLVASANPCCMTLPLAEDLHGRIAAEATGSVVEAAAAADAVAVGPGLGQSSDLVYLLAHVARRCPTPLVLDADALNALAPRLEWLRDRPAATILTPHPGEFARLTGRTTTEVQANRRELAVQFARANKIVLVLKGQGTIVTDGQQLFVNATGNPGMATGGSGDVLAGLIAALLGQRLDHFTAAQLGVHVHGLAGDLARAEIGETALTAADLLDHLGPAFLAHQGDRG